MCFAWQGWKISLPPEWNPQRIEGDFENGYALIADLYGPRLGMRWTTLSGKSQDAKAVIESALKGEVGQLAADEASDVETELWPGAKLYIEPMPPGRDVWIAESSASKRIVQLMFHRKVGEANQLKHLVETLSDGSNDVDQVWSVFDLSCRIESRWKLTSKALNAGDLALSFSDGRESLTCRQLALASMALKRQPIERWLADLQSPHLPRYRKASSPTTVQWKTSDGRTLAGVTSTMSRKKWLGWAWHLPKQWSIAAVHDQTRDRLILMQSTHAEAMQEVGRSIGTVN